MESKIEKHKKRFTITQIVLMVMAKAPGSCCSLEYLSEKTSVDKDELLVYLSRLAQRAESFFMLIENFLYSFIMLLLIKR
uniref:plasmid regulator n=1 Tax=Saccharolobus solfataricus TaxID=2287 RepID=UPI00159CC002|nr:plasmid regulator [Saccharolobus solfataricus]